MIYVLSVLLSVNISGIDFLEVILVIDLIYKNELIYCVNFRSRLKICVVLIKEIIVRIHKVPIPVLAAATYLL